MITLQLSESRAGDDAYDVAVRLSGGGHRCAGSFRVRLRMSAEDRRQVRWYFEDFLRFPDDPAPRIARDVEEQLTEWGVQLGRKLAGALFCRCAGHGLEDLWAVVVDGLADVRVEIETDFSGAGLPWELLRDPRTGRPLAARAGSFVRVHTAEATTDSGRGLPPGTRPRVLLVVSRPNGTGDVPFRRVAEQLLHRAETAAAQIRVDVLRPAGFARLREVLGHAAEEGHPYDVVHFDGHGTYGDEGGYLAFEQPDGTEARDRCHWVQGDRLADVLRDSRVRVLVMNACRSAYAENSLGSLAQEVAGAGVPGVVAMQYNVTVGTAAQFVGGFYEALFAGHTLGEAVGLARRRMLDSPTRGFHTDRLTLQDWSVPLVYEEQPLTLVTVDGAGTGPDASRPALGGPAPLPDDADGQPLVGRDAVILELDRSYDRGRVALLSGLAGSGKTSVARAFAAWYRATGGLRDPRGGDGPVLFTSFADLDGLDALLDAFGAGLPEDTDDGGTSWDRLDRKAKGQQILDIAARRPLLWIWDAVDTVAGLSADEARPWPARDTEELRRLLAQLAGTRARVLLTSRRPETHLVPEVSATRIALAGMDAYEQVALVTATATRAGLDSVAPEDWLPLLVFADGNPRAIEELVMAAASAGVAGREGVLAFVAGLHSRGRGGRSPLSDDASLATALAHAVRRAVGPRHHHVLAALHLFRQTTHSGVLADMTRRLAPRHGSEQQPEDECRRLLETCSDLGLMEGPGQGSHRMHPALPGLLSDLFHEVFGPPGSPAALLATRAYVESVTKMCAYYSDALQDGNTDLVGNMLFAEANLRHARELARTHDWGDEYDGCTQSLAQLHRYLGNRERWERTVEELAEATSDPATGQPRPGREEGWSASMQLRVRLARDERDWERAEELERTLIRHERTAAAAALTAPPEGLPAQGRHSLLGLAACLGTMGQIRREQGEADCLRWFEEALDLQRRVGDRLAQFSSHFNIAEAYRKVPAIRNLDEADRHFVECLDLVGPDHRLSRVKVLGELGYVAWLRYLDAQEADAPREERREFLITSLRHYSVALADTPVGALHTAATFHNQLGLLHEDLGNEEASRGHLQESLRLFLEAEDSEGAGRALGNLAFMLLRQDRSEEARPYLVEALRHLEPFGERLELVNDVREALASVDAARADPLVTAQQTVARRMRLAAEDPTWLPALANSLSRLGTTLSARGRHQEALEATREAVQWLERLAATDPTAHEPALASALHNLGNRHAYLGQTREALGATERALEIRQRLATEDLSAHGPDLAATLRNLSEDLWAAGRPQGALMTSRMTVMVWRALNAADRSVHEVSLAQALNELADRLHRMGLDEEARACLEESEPIWRRKAEEFPPSQEAELARTLLNLGDILLVLGRPEESLAATRESVAVLRHLADGGSAEITVRFAKALGALANSLCATGEWEKAAQANEESVAWWRTLVEQDVDEAPSGLALTLQNLGVTLISADRLRAAEAALEESIRLFRPLAARHPNYRRNIAAAEKDLAELRDG